MELWIWIIHRPSADIAITTHKIAQHGFPESSRSQHYTGFRGHLINLLDYMRVVNEEQILVTGLGETCLSAIKANKSICKYNYKIFPSKSYTKHFILSEAALEDEIWSLQFLINVEWLEYLAAISWYTRFSNISEICDRFATFYYNKN
jgi:hypothetical protein